MLQIVKASAGSGKTTRLSNTYIDILLRSADPQEYRRILAVTFTNKATEEMKERILSDLFELSCDKTNPDSKKAGQILHAILHDYSNFAVSTIDSFFQRTLRAFAHETGHYSSSQVELSKDSLIEEAVDTILDSLDETNPEDTALLDFITESMEQDTESGKKLNIDDELKMMAKELRSEQFWQKSSEISLDVKSQYTPEKLRQLKALVYGEMNKREDSLVSQATEIVRKAASLGLAPEDFSGGSRSWFCYFDKVARHKKGEKEPELTESCRNKAQNHDSWFSKANASYKDKAVAAIGALVDGYFDYYNASLVEYKTASMVSRSIYGLAIAQRLETVFEQVANEHNVICLDESNRLLKDIIDGSDAPFVYEKTGTRIGHYLLDEFQDTSSTQWANFQPLLENAVAEDTEFGKPVPNVSNLIVGDVKQSIYRWRESDWSLMESKVAQIFPTADQDTLLQNYRSTEEVINFNTAFYTDAAQKLDLRCGSGSYITNIYADVAQTPGKDKQRGRGFVELKFCQDRDSQLDCIVEAVKREIQENKARPCDIAILVRKNDKGSLIASRLVSEGINVETEASFTLNSSVSVRRLVSMLSYINNPEDKLNAYVAASMEIKSFPTGYHNLTGLCDQLYLILKNDPKCGPDCDSELVFITAFMDFVRDFASRNGDNLGDFLKYWEEKNSENSISKPCVSSSLSSDSVKILTIHKSKGLAFPYVIVPFVEDIKLFNSTKTIKWCKPENVAGTPLEGLGDKLFRVNLSKAAEDSAFAKDFRDEWLYQSVDAINMMYVATTRARLGMTIISGKVSADSFSSLLSEYAQGVDKTLGMPCIYKEDDDSKEDKKKLPCPMEYNVHPLGERLGIRPYAADYFLQENNEYKELRPVTRGVVLHDILARIEVPSDLPAAVRSAVEGGLLAESSYEQVLALLGNALALHPEFFPQDASGRLPEGYKVYREVSVLCPEGYQIRPDRVVVSPDGHVTIVDYKFGKDDTEYTEQIHSYADAYQKMGYSTVEAKLWFVFKNYLR